MNWSKNFMEINENFRDFRVFDFALYPISKSQKFAVFSNFDSIFNWRFRNDKKNELKQKIWEEKGKFLRFTSFRFCPKPKIESSEISKICLLLQILAAVVTEDLKTTKKWTKTKTKRLRYCLKRKNENFRKFRAFDFNPHPKSKTCKSWKIFFYFNSWLDNTL